MIQSKNIENIYGFTCKRKNNFLNSSIQGAYKKQDTKIEQSNIKEFVIKTLIFLNEIDNIQSVKNGDETIGFGDVITDPNNYLNKELEFGDGTQLVLLQHEKGISVRTNNYSIFPSIHVDGEKETITLRRQEGKLKIKETKISFRNIKFPFHYVYEPNPDYDGIFNDFVLHNLSEIKPPSILSIQVKNTPCIISYRQYVGYIKTRSFLNLKVDDQGWFVHTFSEAEEDLPSGVDVFPDSYWVYHPRCDRIEHYLQFP